MGIRSENARIREELTQRFLSGEMLSVKDIIEDYYEVPDEALLPMIKNSVRGQVNIVRKILREDYDKALASCTPEHEYGIPTTKEHYTYIGIKSSRVIGGMIERTQYVMDKGVRAGLITGNTRRTSYLVPKVEINE